MAIQLETERLRFRQWRQSDLDPFHAFYADPVSQGVFGGKKPRPDVWRQMAMFIGHFELRGFSLWALEDKASGAFAGYGGLWHPEGRPDAEVGYGIVPHLRGRGLATEAAQCARDHGFRALGIARLVSYIQPANKPSVRIAEKLGAEANGTIRMQSKAHTIYVHRKT